VREEGSVEGMKDHRHTFDMGFAALTGRPFALTGARVPAFSAFLCSRLIYEGMRLVVLAEKEEWYMCVLCLSWK
jgi:hypothetical protein